MERSRPCSSALRAWYKNLSSGSDLCSPWTRANQPSLVGSPFAPAPSFAYTSFAATRKFDQPSSKVENALACSISLRASFARFRRASACCRATVFIHYLSRSSTTPASRPSQYPGWVESGLRPHFRKRTLKLAPIPDADYRRHVSMKSPPTITITNRIVYWSLARRESGTRPASVALPSPVRMLRSKASNAMIAAITAKLSQVDSTLNAPRSLERHSGHNGQQAQQ